MTFENIAKLSSIEEKNLQAEESKRIKELQEDYSNEFQEGGQA